MSSSNSNSNSNINNGNINNRFAPVRRPRLHTIIVDRRQEHFNGTSLMLYIRTELVKYLLRKPLKHPVSGAPMTEDQFLKIAKEVATKHPTFLERLWTYPKDTHYMDMSGMYARALVYAYSGREWEKLANVQRILLVAAEALNISHRQNTRQDYMLIPDVYERYQVTPDLRNDIFSLDLPTLKARYPDRTIVDRGGYRLSTHHGKNPLVAISKSYRHSRHFRSISTSDAWTDIAKYLTDVVTRQNRTVHKDFDYLLKHNGVFLPEVLIRLGTMHRDRRITTNTFEAAQNILKRGIIRDRKIQSEHVEHYVSQIALHFEMKPIIKHINMNALFSGREREHGVSVQGDVGKYYRTLFYPGRRLTQERFEFFKWLFQYIPITDKPRLVKIIVRLSDSRVPQFPKVSKQLLTDFIKWAAKIAGNDHISTLFRNVVDFAKAADPGTMYSDREQMVEVIKYLRTIVVRRGSFHTHADIQANMFNNAVRNITNSSPKVWIKHAVVPTSKSTIPKNLSKFNPKKLKEFQQQTILHPEANAEDIVTMERVPLNQAVTLRGHDTNGKVRHIFHQNSVKNLMKNYRWYNRDGRYTPRNIGRGKHPLTSKTFYKENVVPLRTRLSEHERQLYNMLLQKNNAGGNKHAKVKSVFNHLEAKKKAERAAKKKKEANKKRKRNANTNSTKPNNKGKKAKSASNISAINLTRTNSNASSKRIANNRPGPSTR